MYLERLIHDKTLVSSRLHLVSLFAAAARIDERAETRFVCFELFHSAFILAL